MNQESLSTMTKSLEDDNFIPTQPDDLIFYQFTYWFQKNNLT